jgi:hypothetical protein
VLRNGGLQLGGQKRPGKARERRGEWLTAIMTAMQEKAKEGRRDGRGGTRVGTTRKNPGGEGTPTGVGTGGVRGSDERGDRRAEERQKRVQNEGNGRNGTDEGRDRDRTDKRGKCVRWGRKRKISVASPHHAARTELPTVSTVCVGWAAGGRVRDGKPPSPFKKKEEGGICNSSLIKIIFDQSFIGQNERGSKRGTPPISSPFLCYCAYLLFTPLLGPHRNAAKESKAGKWRALNGSLTVLRGRPCGILPPL